MPQLETRQKVNALGPEKTDTEMKKAKDYLTEVANLLHPHAGPWMFGHQQPTELDARTWWS
jgi:hypothetical protein